jgi:hypothetical protein
MKFSWTVSPSANVVPSDTMLLVNAGVLSYGQVYTFTFKGTDSIAGNLILSGEMASNSSIYATSAITITVVPSNPDASIQYGSRSVSIDDTLTLTSLSKDVDNAQGLLLLDWTCMDISQETPVACINGVNDTTLNLPTTPSFSIDAGTLSIGTYLFTLQATVNSTGLFDTTTATIYIIAGSPPSVFITNPATKKQSPSDKITLYGNATTIRADAVIKYYWTCTTSNFDFNQNTTATSRSLPNLVIKPFSLLGGVTCI